jgi:3-hydroxyisobutyrate dehydrogenase
MTPVGIIGVGNMGGGMAAHLLAQGWPVHVRDLDSDKEQCFKHIGAVDHASPAQLAMHCVVTIVCVVDAAQTREVLFGAAGAAAAMHPGHAVMLCPTIAPQDVEALAGELAARGIHTIDAPMSGGPSRARATAP